MIQKYLLVIKATLVLSLVVASYFKGAHDKEVSLLEDYVEQLESVQKENDRLEKLVAKKESEITEKEFEYETRIDNYVGNIRTNVIRLRINPQKSSLPQNEPAKCGDNEAGATYLDSRISEELALCNGRRNQVVFQLMKCQSYVRENLKVVNGE